MNIKQHDFVLEIGSGDNPNPRSDILCDRYITTSHERAGGFTIRIDRPMVVADGMRLPFPDQSFDYVITSHIFEHMDDPVGFAREIMRVGKAGFIEVPSAISERVFGWNFHHWYCDIRSGVLTFTPKKEGEQFGGFFHRLIARELWFRRWFEEHEHEWYVRMEWKEKIAIRVKTSSVSGDEWALLAAAKPETLKDCMFAVRFFLRRCLRKIRKTMRQLVWNVNNSTDWIRLIICPKCYGALRMHGEGMICNRCKIVYSVDGRVPILLVEKEKRKGY